MKKFKELEQRDPWFFIIIALIFYFGIWFNAFLAGHSYIYYYSFGEKQAVDAFAEGLGYVRQDRYDEVATVTKYVYDNLKYTEETKRVVEALREEQAACGTKAYIEYLILSDRGIKCYLPTFKDKLTGDACHMAAAVMIDGRCYIADPTNNLLLPIERYCRYYYELTSYWERKLQKYLER